MDYSGIREVVGLYSCGNNLKRQVNISLKIMAMIEEIKDFTSKRGPDLLYFYMD